MLTIGQDSLAIADFLTSSSSRSRSSSSSRRRRRRCLVALDLRMEQDCLKQAVVSSKEDVW